MLDPWIIEQIRKREEAQRPQDRPVAELPEYPAHPPSDGHDGYDGRDRYDGDQEPGSDRGVTIIDFSC
jgi:hypothetical protein